MKLYRVRFSKILSCIVDIEAESREEAKEIFEQGDGIFSFYINYNHEKNYEITNTEIYFDLLTEVDKNTGKDIENTDWC